MNNFNSYSDHQFINNGDGRISPLSAFMNQDPNDLNSKSVPLYNNMIANHYQNRPNSSTNYNQYYNPNQQYISMQDPQYQQQYYNNQYYQYNNVNPMYTDSPTPLNTQYTPTQYNPLQYNHSQYLTSDQTTPGDYNNNIIHPNVKNVNVMNNMAHSYSNEDFNKVNGLSYEHKNEEINKMNELSEISELYGIDVTSVQGDRLPTRSILLSNIPSTTSAKTILNHVKVGIIQQLLILPTDSNNGTISAKLTFLILKHSIEFYCDALLKKLSIEKNKINIEYVDEVPQAHLTKRILRLPHYKPTRNLFIAGFYNLNEDTLHKRLVTDLSSFGPIDIIKIIKDKGIAFIHFLDIEDCIQAFLSVNSYSDFYENKKMGFGRDRCEFVTITERYNATISNISNNENGLQVIPNPNVVNPNIKHSDTQYFTNSEGKVMKKIPIPLSSYLKAQETFPTNVPFLEVPKECPYVPVNEENLNNRNIFIGGLPLNTTLTTICNTVRGGSLEKVKLIKDKNICFVTFLETQAALDFHNHYQANDFIINKKKCIIKWGKHSGLLDPLLKFAVFKGASRNVYIGGVKFNSNNNSKDPFSWVNIKKTFSKFGEVEQINFLMDKGCFFVNFASIQSAVECLDKLRDDPLYKDLQMNYGKDRVGNKRRA